MEDQFVSIVILLFILSLISERISNFIKLYLPRLREKNDDPEKEKIRERSLMWISWLSGVGVALFGYYAVINHDTFKTLLAFEAEDQLPLGILVILFTSIFLTFGSKFWHDLLDLVFQVKNLRRKLVDEKTFRLDNMKDLMDHLYRPSEEVAKKTLQENAKQLIEIPGVQAVGLGVEKVGQQRFPVIDIHVVDEKAAKQIDPALTTTVNDQVERIKTRIILTDQNRAHWVFPGGAIRNKAGEGGGTLGCIVKHKNTEELYLLSCYHVLKASTHTWYLYAAGSAEEDNQIILSDEAEPVASLQIGLCNSEIDAALARVTAVDRISSFAINRQNTISGIRTVDPLDKYQGTAVRIKGKTSESFKSGIVWDDSVNVEISYYSQDSPAPVHKMHFENLFSITDIEDEKLTGVSCPGDSGSLVLDTADRVMGMIVGGNKKVSYVIPIERILSAFNIEIISTNPLNV